MTVGKPASEGYQEYMVDGFKIHLFKDARTEHEVVIDAPGFSFFRRLAVAGIQT